MGGKIVPDRFAIMTLDPGGTSAVATGLFRTDRGDDMLRSVFERAVKKRQIRSWEVRGDSELQAWAICEQWSNFKFRCNVEYFIPEKDIHFVIEDFALRELNAQLNSVEVIAGIKTLLVKKLQPKTANDNLVRWPLGRPEYQQPSTAKRVKNDRLRDLGIWVVGSEHERDARRHLVAKVSEIL